MSTGLIEGASWATTLAGIARRHATAELVIEAAGDKRYRIAFQGGAIVGATSPLPNDSAVRIATVNNFVPRSLAPELAKRVTATPGCDELELLVDGATLTLEQTAALWRIILAQRAARTFAIDAGRFAIANDITIKTIPGTSVDVGAVVYQGSRLNLAEDRLDAHLRGVGTYFVMRPDADLTRFGFDEEVQPVIDALTHGSNLPELEAKHRDIDPRTLRALVSTLVACEQCEAFFEAAITAPVLPAEAPVATFKKLDGGSYSDRSAGRDVVAEPISYRVAPPSTPPPFAAAAPPPAVTRAPTGPAVTRTPTGPTVARAPTGRPAVARTPTGPAIPRTSTDDAIAGEEAFQRGLKALRAERLNEAIFELEEAHERAPQLADVLTYLAWAQFCAATDKQAMLAKTREACLYAIQHSPTPVLGWFFLGRAERMVGMDKDALRHFHEVLNIDPKHAEAAAEVRMLEARLGRG